ncbi:acyl-CoA dehydrogenase family protein [Haliea sp. E1-2-M8]|uniref:acyl-CoA dehydrogenase family protein n=1 Tax=Haliea sp. E1-2-M8 TaxID=3064706 RepID=UPI0027274606|nr:acyl-CoA dehydrogenase family protein [Haliea sp. E1-2-M8]MDO8864002.1 acyl-CoA dehydrogenase family protein [Haliea sp. E1-2-M8]
MAKNSAGETPEQSEFRAHCREWLKKNVPAPPAFKMPATSGGILSLEQLEYARSWQLSAYNAGLIGCDYPSEYGGGGRSNCQAIANQEMRNARTPVLAGMVGLQIVAGSMCIHGSEAVKRRFLGSIFSAQELWCQGFSEPCAGSDLASLQTFAQRKGDRWIINGHKVWTSMAQFADWMLLAARTDKHEKYKGLTVFVVPVKAELDKSVTVRPLVKITGDAEFNEVRLDNLEIEDSYRVGEIGEGWNVISTTLAHERGAGFYIEPLSGGQGLQSKSQKAEKIYPLVELARNSVKNGKPVSEDPVLMDRLMKMLTRSQGIRQMRRMRSVKDLAGNPARFAMQDKVVAADYLQQMSALAMEIQGCGSTLATSDPNAPDGGRWSRSYLDSFGATIAGGTNEIQRNIIGEKILGLAKTK